MDKAKLDDIIEHSELIQKLTTLIPTSNALAKRRIDSVIREAEMIIQLAKSIKEPE